MPPPRIDRTGTAFKVNRMSSSIKITTLSSGLRVITDTVPTVESVAVGVWADAGTRHENMAHNGVAHMVEHMMFKGTPTRSAAAIAEEVEDVGGHMNAYTSRDVTSYHIHLLKEDLSLALDIVSDITQRPLMPEHEVERERYVILQEIGMSLDTPDDLVFDLYQETAYQGQALGAPILGTNEIIGGMQRDTLMGYVRHFYTPGRLVVSAAGNLDHDAFVADVEARFTDLPADEAHSFAPASYAGGESRLEKELEQSHVILGFQGISRLDDDFYAALALSTMLGGGMSSRLFQEVREKRGLVYSVFSAHTAYQDDGQFSIYAGTGPKDLPELIPVLCDEILKATAPFSEKELARAKAQMKAGLLMSRESMLSRANLQAKYLIHHGAAFDIRERLFAIEGITLEDVQAAARRIFATKPTLAALGPLKRLESYERILERLSA